MATVEGLDISVHQGAIDWSAITQSELNFVYVRATIGGRQLDPHFSANWSAVGDTGLIRGAYHFFWPLTAWQDQSNNFVNSLGALETGDLPPALDLEEAIDANDPQRHDCWLDVPADQRLPMIQNWLNAVERAVGCKPVIYTRQNFIEGLLGGGVQQLADHPLWIAHYDVQQPVFPHNWASWNFWQYTEKGSVRGINGYVDRDRFNGSLSDLRTMTMS